MDFTDLLIKFYWYFMKMIIQAFWICRFGFNTVLNIYTYYFPKKIDLHNILLIKNSKIIQKLKDNYFINTSVDFEYIIYKKPYNNKILIIFLYNLDEIKTNPKYMEPCNYVFLSVIIKQDDCTHNITTILNNIGHYYYIPNNILFNEIFMNWLFINHLKIKLNNYSINILDNQANELLLNNKQYILLNKDSYEIMTL